MTTRSSAWALLAAVIPVAPACSTANGLYTSCETRRFRDAVDRDIRDVVINDGRHECGMPDAEWSNVTYYPHDG